MAETLATELFQGKVTHIIDPFNFWAQIGTESDTHHFHQLTEELNQFCKSVGVFSDDADCGEIDRGYYILVYQHGEWFRAQVARVDCINRSVDVFYLDTGDTDMVHVNQICIACPNIFYKLKPQAVKCRIAGIVPLAKNWTSRGIKCFKEKTKEKVFQTAIVNVDPHFLYHEVSLYNSDEEGRSIAHILMDEEIAMPSDVEVPEFATDVKSALPDSYLISLFYDTDEQSNLYSETCSPVSCDYTLTASSTDNSNQPSYSNSPADQLFTSTEDTNTTTNSVNSISPASGDDKNLVLTKDGEGKSDISCTSNPLQSVTSPLCENNMTKQSTSSEDFSLKETPTPQKIYTDAWSCHESEKSEISELPSPEIAIPSFNLSVIKETKTVCPEKLQEEKNMKRRLTTKYAIEENLEKIHDEMEYQDDCSVPEQWGMSDLNIANPQDTNQDVCDKIKSQIESLQSKPQDQETDIDFCTSRFVKNYSRNINCKEHPSPQPFYRNHAHGESQFHLKKEIEKVLKGIVKEDPVVVCEKLHHIVPAGVFCDEKMMSVCLESLLCQSVKDKKTQDALLKILDTYSACDMFGQCMESVIKKLSSIYIKRPIHKALHLDFAHLLVQLLYLSKYWTERFATQMTNLMSNLVEKWIKFNELGRGGKQMTETSELHLSCLEILWPTLITELSDARYMNLLKELELQLLKDGITRTTRKRLLNVYITKREVRSGVDAACNTDATCATYVLAAQLKSDLTTQTTPVQYSTQSSQTDTIQNDVHRESQHRNEDQQEKDVKDEVGYDVSYYMFGDDEDDEYDLEDTQETSMSLQGNISDAYTTEKSKEKMFSENKQTPTMSPVTSFSVIRRNEGSASDGYSSASSVSSHKLSAEKKNKTKDFFDVKSSDPVNVSRSFERNINIKFLNTEFKLEKKSASRDHAKSKKSRENDKKNYNSWAECVKKEKTEADTTSLQADHLKHLAIQTLKSGVLKGKNIPARRQLSAEDLKSNSISSIAREQDFPTLCKKSSDRSSSTSKRQGKFLPLKKSPKGEASKKVHGKGKRISGKDLPMRAKLTRELLEEQLEDEILMKFAPQTHSLTYDQRREDYGSKFPSLKKSVKDIPKVTVDKKPNSLQNIASDILLASCVSEQKNNGETKKSTGDVPNSLGLSYHGDGDGDGESFESRFLESSALKNDVPSNSTTAERKKPHCPVKIETGWTPKNRTCTSCGEANHLVYDCPYKIGILF